MRRRLVSLALAVAATIALSLAALSFGATSSTLLVSPANDPDAPGFPTEHVKPAISGDGRFVAYVGSVGETGEGVFLRDMNGGTTAVNVPEGINQQGLGFTAGAPSLSGDGRYLAFASEDPNLSGEDLNGSTTLAGDTFPVRDIFVYNRAIGRTKLVSRNSGAKGAAFNNDSNSPSISADGRYIAFGTQATNFIRGVFGGLFIRDLRTNKTILAGRADGARGEPLRTAIEPSISAHGRWVAFVTTARTGHGRATLEIGVRDMKTKRTVLASRGGGANAPLAGDDSAEPALSANGRWVAFATKAKNLGRTDRKDIEDVFVRDLKTNRTSLVSRASGKRGTAGDGDSSSPSISANGRYIAFVSYAGNLGPADNGTHPDVFVRDMRRGRVTLISRADSGGAASNAPSAEPAISAAGGFVAFESRGSNLNPTDTLHFTSVFRSQLLP